MERTVDQTTILAFAQATRISELDDIEALIRAYRPKVLRFVTFSINDVDAAESITQDCFLKAYNGRASFRGDCAVSTWLMSIAANLVRDHTRTQKFKFWRNFRNTAADVTELGQHLDSGETSAERRMLAREQVARVQDAIKDLSPRQRSVFVMRFLDEMDLAEIAATTGMPVATVKTHLHRAVTAIRGQLRNTSTDSLRATAPNTGAKR